MKGRNSSVDNENSEGFDTHQLSLQLELGFRTRKMSPPEPGEESLKILPIHSYSAQPFINQALTES